MKLNVTASKQNILQKVTKEGSSILIKTYGQP